MTREKYRRGELQIVQVAVSNGKAVTVTYPTNEREIVIMSLNNIEATSANREDGADY